jgi:hypothetical protein
MTMPKINFANVSAVSAFAPLPADDYVCRMGDIETDVTRSGDTMWKLRWTVESGEHAGRILFDNLVFSARAMPRVKLVCESCGLDVSGELDLEPTVLMDKRARVTTYIEEYCDEQGVTKARNRVPFDGYRPIAANGADCPF